MNGIGSFDFLQVYILSLQEDKGFDRHAFHKQMCVMRGQVIF